MKNVSVLISLGCLTAALTFAAAPAADLDTRNRNWPQWRGPTGNGVAPHGDPPTEWSESKNLRWKVPIPGGGHATPIIWENRIFILTAVPAGAEPTQPHAFTTLCLDRQTGKVIWQKVGRQEVPHEGHQPSNSYASGSPVTDGEHVYAFFGSRGLYCYDMDGTLVWKLDLGKMRTRNGFGEGSSPALHRDRLVVLWDTEDDSFVYAFDKATGKELWKQRRDERTGWTTPYVVQYQDRWQVVINATTAVRSYDLETGNLLWSCSGQTANAIPSVVADAQTVYALSGFRGSAALAIQLGRSGDLTDTDAVRWQVNRGTPYVPSPLLYDGHLYFCQRNDPLLSCVDAATGQVYYAQERLEGLTGVYASPVGAAHRIYLAGRNGVTVVLEQSRELKILATNTLDDPIDASPAVVGNELFLRGHAHLYCIAEN